MKKKKNNFESIYTENIPGFDDEIQIYPGNEEIDEILNDLNPMKDNNDDILFSGNLNTPNEETPPKQVNKVSAFKKYASPTISDNNSAVVAGFSTQDILTHSGNSGKPTSFSESDFKVSLFDASTAISDYTNPLDNDDYNKTTTSENFDGTETSNLASLLNNLSFEKSTSNTTSFFAPKEEALSSSLTDTAPIIPETVVAPKSETVSSETRSFFTPKEEITPLPPIISESASSQSTLTTSTVNTLLKTNIINDLRKLKEQKTDAYVESFSDTVPEIPSFLTDEFEKFEKRRDSLLKVGRAKNQIFENSDDATKIRSEDIGFASEVLRVGNRDIKEITVPTEEDPNSENAPLFIVSDERRKISETGLLETLEKAVKYKQETETIALNDIDDAKENTKSLELLTKNDYPLPQTPEINIASEQILRTSTEFSENEETDATIRHKTNENDESANASIYKNLVLEEETNERDLLPRPPTKRDFDSKNKNTENDNIKIRNTPLKKEFLSAENSEEFKNILTKINSGIKLRVVSLFFLGLVSLILTVLNDFNVDLAYRVFKSFDTSVLDRRYFTSGYIILNIAFGLVAFLLSTGTLKEGFSKLFCGKPDGDSLVSASALISVIALIPPLFNEKFSILYSSGIVNSYVFVAIWALFFNAFGKLLTIKRAKRTFRIMGDDKEKYFADIISDKKLAKSFGAGIVQNPKAAVFRKTLFLQNFTENTYSPDYGDKLSGIFLWISLAVGGIIGVCAYSFGTAFSSSATDLSAHNAAFALAAVSAAFAAFTSFALPIFATSPLERVSSSLSATRSAVSGYNAAAKFADVNLIITDAKSLFPTASIAHVALKECKSSNRQSELSWIHAITLVTSMLKSVDSVMLPCFMSMIYYDEANLPEITDCKYEENHGLLCWYGKRRLFFGNLNHMHNHGIAVPDASRIRASAPSPDCEPLFFAEGNEVIIIFYFKIIPNELTKFYLKSLTENGVSIAVRTIDAFVTVGNLAELFDIPPENIRILPNDFHSVFDKVSKYMPAGRGDLICDGSFTSFANAIVGAKVIIESIRRAKFTVIAGVALGALGIIIFIILRVRVAISPTAIFIWNLFFLALSSFFGSPKDSKN